MRPNLAFPISVHELRASDSHRRPMSAGWYMGDSLSAVDCIGVYSTIRHLFPGARCSSNQGFPIKQLLLNLRLLSYFRRIRAGCKTGLKTFSVVPESKNCVINHVTQQGKISHQVHHNWSLLGRELAEAPSGVRDEGAW